MTPRYRIGVLPTRRSVWTAAGLALASAAMGVVLAQAGIQEFWITRAAAIAAMALAAAALVDYLLSRRRLARHPITFERHLPNALALGQSVRLPVSFAHDGPWAWQLAWFDHVPSTFALRGLPASLVLPGASRVDTRCEVTPLRRGGATFEPADVRVRSAWGFLEIRLRLGASQSLRVLPNFAAVSRYAWLAGDRRLAEIGIKTYAARGAGTDFKQLGEYVPGMPTRHIDWKASLHHGRAVVREYQDDRDQSVMFMLDCGRRMKADDRAGTTTGSHFDQALDAMLLLAYVALKSGDAVGAMTFAGEPGAARLLAPAKGLAALNTLVARLHDVEPGPAHPDYLAAARDLMLRLRRRSLVVVLTNFRDEDGDELHDALTLMRTRHLVLLASLKERVIGDLREQPLADAEAVAEVGAAHWFARARADAFRRLADRDRLLVDAEPRELAAALVNRYHAVKRARLL
jgi:uncharacterized protein (DUF58 family)